MWSFFTEARWTVLLVCLGCIVGPSRAGAPRDPDCAARAELRAALDGERIIETGMLDEMVSSRDRQHAIATEAAARVMQSPAGGEAAPPDSSVRDWIDICTAAYARALRQEAVRLDRGGTHGEEFPTMWNEMTRVCLDILDRRPGLWLEDVGGRPGGAGPRVGVLPEQLILLCSPEAYAGESFTLPREALFARMATLPESLFQCCVDPEECLSQRGAKCPDRLLADIARQTDLDALVGYRNGSRYWSLPSDAPPRGRPNDAAVARAQGEAALEMLSACAGTRLALPAGGAVISRVSACAALRESRMLWPSDADPFITVPGLRDPRTDSEGRIVCDLALSEGCLTALPPTLRARLEARLAPDARIVQAAGVEGE